MNILSNEKIDLAKVEMAKKIITDLQNEALLDGIITPDEQMILDMVVDNKNIPHMDKALMHEMNPMNNPSNMDNGVVRNTTLEEKNKEIPPEKRKRGRPRKRRD